MSLRPWIALFATAAAIASPAAAQRVAGEDPKFASPGVTSVTPISGRGYELSANLRTLFDDNILRTNDTRIRPGSKSDFRFSPSVSAAIGQPVGRQQLFLGGSIGRDIYARNTQLNRNFYNLGAGANLRAGSACTGNVSSEFDRRQNLLSDATETIPNVQKRFTVGGTVDCRSGAGIGFGGSVTHGTIKNDNVRRKPFDTQSTTYAPRLSYGSPTLGQFSLTASYDNIDYTGRTVAVAMGGAPVQVGDGVKIYNLRFGYQRGVGTRLKVAAGIGYNKTKPDPVSILDPIFFGPIIIGYNPVNRPDHSGLTYDASISYSSGSRLNAQISASRNTTSSPNVGALYVINQAYGIDLGYDISRAISTGIGATYNIRDYRGAFGTITEPPRIKDKTGRFYARIGYAPVKLYDIDLEVAHQNRDSDPPTLNYSGTSVILSLRVKFGRN